MIAGRRVALRPVEESDFPLIQRWQNHPEVWWWMDYERPFSSVDVRESEERARKEGHPYIIEVGGRPIGRIGLDAFRTRDRICSIYVFVGEPDDRDEGYGTDAAMTLLGFAFDRLALHQVESSTIAENLRAIRMFEKCGFEIEATLHDRSFKDGRFFDRVVMTVDRDAFASAYARMGSGD